MAPRRAAVLKTAALFCLLAAGLALAACGGGASTVPTPSQGPSPALATPAPAPAPVAPSPSAPPAAPSRDLLDLAKRFRGASQDVTGHPLRTYEEGDSDTFYVIDLETPRAVTIRATVALVTDHAYFFVEDGVSYSPAALEQIGRDFEDVVYPAVTSAFGQIPRLEHGQRVTLLHARLTGAGGYFNQGDEFPTSIVPLSNDREILYIDAGALESPGTSYNALAAHELQHLIHYYADPDEEAWVNEGLSQIAAEIVGGGSDWLRTFLLQPDTQLNDWPDTGDSAVHYAASELFFRYLLDRFGGAASAHTLTAEPADGIAGVDAFLRRFGTTFEDVFADWVAANYLDAPDGRYAHRDLDARVKIKTAVRQPGPGEGSVSQFGADYLEIGAPGGIFVFDGADSVSVGVPPSDGAFWWAGGVDGIDARLTRELDLTGLSQATLRFSFWAQIERGWDYAYVALSLDGGERWQALPGQYTTDYDPVGNAYGPGYTGDSGGWQQEEIDLTPFAGRRVLLRFEYVTDDATNLPGFAIDDIEVPEAGFLDTGDGDAGWRAEGFQQVRGPLPQRFIVQKVEGGQVTRVELDETNRAEIPLAGPATIIISGSTPGTSEAAAYNWELRR